MNERNTDATRTIVMTGATSGIGKLAALKLLQDAPDVHLVVLARSPGTTIAEALKESSGNPHVSSLTADLASLDSIRAATTALRDELDRDVLPPLTGIVGNAGTQFVDATQSTVDGLETTFAVNVLANHVLVDELREQLSVPGRIVFTTSDTHFGGFAQRLLLVPGPRWDEPTRLATPGTGQEAQTATAGRTAYSTSKLGVIYLVHALARRLPPGIDVFSFNPSLTPGTDLVRAAGPITRFVSNRILPALTFTPFARPVSVSGADLAAAAIGPIPGESGSYINGARVERSSLESYDPEREDALWDELKVLGAG